MSDIEASPFLEQPTGEKPEARAEATIEGRDTSVEKKNYKTQQIENPKDPLIASMHELMQSKSPGVTVDGKEVTENALLSGNYLVFVATDTEGKVVAFCTGSLHHQLDANGMIISPHRVFLGSWYMVNGTDDKKIMGRLYAKMKEAADQKAAYEGKQIIGSVNEASDPKDVEDFHYKGMYIRTGEKTYEEVKYYQAPLKFDEKTGNGVTGDGEDKRDFKKNEAPLRLMFDASAFAPNTSEMSTQELLATVRGINRTNSLDNIDEKVNDASRKNSEAIVKEYETDLEKFLKRSVDGKVVFLDDAGCKAKKDAGFEVKEHKE